jgi:hypothetical protein
MIAVLSGCALKSSKVTVEQTPAAVQRTLQGELAGAQLEDIARKTVNGQTVFETDIIRSGHKWEVNIAEDGRVLSRLQEGAAEGSAASSADAPANELWRDRFDVNRADLLATGNNPYITMQPGRVLRLTNGVDTLTVTILPGAQEVDGVSAGILEERETKGGQLVEVSRNFFATDSRTGDVYYFGEDVDNYKDGGITDHDSAWRAGVLGARFGLMMPAKPVVGQKFFQEIAPKVAMDRVEVVSIDETVRTPAGVFEHCLHLRETTPLDSDVSHKYYAPGVGMIKDDAFELAKRP